MTIPQILREVSRVKPISRVHLYTQLRKARIRPISRVRQKPQQYPEDTARRIIIRFGFNPDAKVGGRR